MKPYNRESTSKSEEIKEMFDTIAPTYDILNHTLSFGIDKGWRRRVIKIIRREKPRKILDLATGTGDVAIALAKKIEDASIIGVDLSQGMLDLAEKKIESASLQQRISLRQGCAEELPFEDGVFDVVTASFGVRNFEDVERGVAEMTRCIKEGGTVVILEFSTPRKGLFAWGYNLYCHHILPLIASLFARKNRSAYNYLPASVDEFYSPKEFVELMQRVGLHECREISLTFGVAHIYTGRKYAKN